MSFRHRAGGALSYRHFRLVWLSAIANSAGTLMYIAALGWVTATTTGSAFKVTLVSFSGLIPLLLVSPLAGALGDRFSRRRVLMVTISGQALVGLGLALAVTFDVAGFPALLGFALANGCLGSVTGPVFQALIPRLVPPEELRNAIVLNSMQFNISRALGPTVAGVLLDVVGAAAVFWLNVASFAPVLLALRAIPDPGAAYRPSVKRSVFGDVAAGARYAARSPGLVAAFGTAAAVALIAGPIQWLTPVVATEGLEVGASQYGLLLGSYGVGAVVGGVLLLSVDRSVPYRRLAAAGLIGLCVGLAGVGLSPGIVPGLASMALVGLAATTVSTTVNSSMQAQLDDRVRGRVVSLWLTTFGGAAPLGLLVQGSLAEVFDIGTVLAGGAVLLLGLYLLLASRGQLRLLDAGQPAAATPATVVTRGRTETAA